ncbi:MAG: VanZ family protein [Bacteroidales bacterium]|nr:VanZ family protein [Bacteroidales bacterium]MCM1415649.1 VanZ family protein [bacterium]MCM1422969.1 VanZ family protein [bacterium]
MKRNLWKVFFAFYIFTILKVIVFKFPMEEMMARTAGWCGNVVRQGFHTANLVPFKTIKMYIEYSYKLNSVENLAGNVLAFIPFGILFPMAAEKDRFFVMLLNVFVLVLGIELFQLFSAFGAFDVDDILLNCLGAALGFGMYRLARQNFTCILPKKVL